MCNNIKWQGLIGDRGVNVDSNMNRTSPSPKISTLIFHSGDVEILESMKSELTHSLSTVDAK